MPQGMRPFFEIRMARPSRGAGTAAHGLPRQPLPAIGAGGRKPRRTGDRNARQPRSANQKRGGRAAPGRGFGFGIGRSPSRWASLRACLRPRRIASPFSRARRSDGFS